MASYRANFIYKRSGSADPIINPVVTVGVLNLLNTIKERKLKRVRVASIVAYQYDNQNAGLGVGSFADYGTVAFQYDSTTLTVSLQLVNAQSIIQDFYEAIAAINGIIGRQTTVTVSRTNKPTISKIFCTTCPIPNNVPTTALWYDWFMFVMGMGTPIVQVDLRITKPAVASNMLDGAFTAQSYRATSMGLFSLSKKNDFVYEYRPTYAEDTMLIELSMTDTTELALYSLVMGQQAHELLYSYNVDVAIDFCI